LKKLRLYLVFALILGFAHNVWAIAVIDRQFSENMVLPMGKQSRIFGTCEPKDVVSLGFRGELYRATANKEGIWQIFLNNGEAGGPFELTLYGGNPIVISNIQVGMVVLVFGNDSTLSTKGIVKFNAEEERRISFLYPSAHYSGLPIKYAIADKGWQKPDYTKQYILPGQLAKNLFNKYKVPIGIIVVQEQGALADAYMPNAALENYAPNPQAWNALNELKLEGIDYENYRHNELMQEYRRWWDGQLAKKTKGFSTPKSFLEGNENFLAWDTLIHPNLNLTNYKQLNNGVYYMHRFLKLPAKLTGNDSVIVFIGKVYDQDSVWINGKFMGATEKPGKLRRYAIHEKELKQTNTVRLLIKVTSFNKSFGGIRLSNDSCILRFGQYRLEFTQVSGYWNYTKTLSFDTISPPSVQVIADKPSLIYNSQIFPFQKYGVHAIVYALAEGKGNDWKIVKGVSTALQTDFPNSQIITWHNKQEGVEAQKQLYGMAQNLWPILTYDLPVLHPIVLANRLVDNQILKPEIKPITTFPTVKTFKVKGEKCILTLNEPLFVISKQNPYVFVITNSEGTSMETSDFSMKGNKLQLNLPKGWKLKYLSYQIENCRIGSYLVNVKGQPLTPFAFYNQ
jgi:sialate O-acetylesterase